MFKNYFYFLDLSTFRPNKELFSLFKLIFIGNIWAQHHKNNIKKIVLLFNIIHIISNFLSLANLYFHFSDLSLLAIFGPSTIGNIVGRVVLFFRIVQITGNFLGQVNGYYHFSNLSLLPIF